LTGPFRDAGDASDVKPVALIADAIRDCSADVSIVLDCFGGTGSTLLVAEKTRRKARLIEFEPGYWLFVCLRHAADSTLPVVNRGLDEIAADVTRIAEEVGVPIRGRAA
jgi:hypothetical protein